MKINIKYRILKEQSRIDTMRQISNLVQSLDMTKYPFVEEHLKTSNGRFELLCKIIDLYMTSGWSIDKCLDTIEYTPS